MHVVDPFRGIQLEVLEKNPPYYLPNGTQSYFWCLNQVTWSGGYIRNAESTESGSTFVRNNWVYDIQTLETQ